MLRRRHRVVQLMAVHRVVQLMTVHHGRLESEPSQMTRQQTLLNRSFLQLLSQRPTMHLAVLLLTLTALLGTDLSVSGLSPTC